MYVVPAAEPNAFAAGTGASVVAVSERERVPPKINRATPAKGTRSARDEPHRSIGHCQRTLPPPQVTSGLVNLLTADEVQAVVAHEVGHGKEGVAWGRG